MKNPNYLFRSSSRLSNKDHAEDIVMMLSIKRGEPLALMVLTKIADNKLAA